MTREDEPLNARPQGQREWLTLGLGFLASGVCLYLVLQGADWTQVLRTIRSADVATLLLAGVIGSFGNVLRAVRWGLLLGYRPPDKVRQLFSSTMIGYLANNILPARLGELARIFALERTAGVYMSTAAATVVAERLLDALVLVALVGVAAFFVPLPPIVHQGAQIVGLVAAAVASVLLWLAWRGEGLVHRIIDQSMARSPRMRGHLREMVGRFMVGLRVWRGSRHALSVFCLSLGIWGLEFVAVDLVMHSLQMQLPALATLCVLVVQRLSFAIPAAPGAVGTYELCVVMALTPFALDGTEALGVALLLHVLMLGTSTLLGLVSLWTESLSLRGVVRHARQRRESNADLEA